MGLQMTYSPFQNNRRAAFRVFDLEELLFSRFFLRIRNLHRFTILVVCLLGVLRLFGRPNG